MKAYELLSEPSRWTKGTLARNSEGYATNVNGPTACSFCLVGAIEHCYPVPIKKLLDIVQQVKDELAIQAPNFEFIGQWNDHPDRTHKEVVDLLKKLDI
jgi:hypothetical protein